MTKSHQLIVGAWRTLRQAGLPEPVIQKTVEALLDAGYLLYTEQLERELDKETKIVKRALQ